MPGNGNGGNRGLSSFRTMWPAGVSGEGGRTRTPATAPRRVSGEGGGGLGAFMQIAERMQPPPAPEPTGPPPPPVRAARNVQRANIDRTSFYDPTGASLEMGRAYLAERSASNPQPPGMTGAGAVGYEMPDGDFDERIY